MTGLRFSVRRFTGSSETVVSCAGADESKGAAAASGAGAVIATVSAVFGFKKARQRLAANPRQNTG